MTACKAYYGEEYRYEIKNNYDPLRNIRYHTNEYRAAEIQRVSKAEELELRITGELQKYSIRP